MEGNVNRQNRYMIPKWRSFKSTKMIGELSSVGNRNLSTFEEEFKRKKNEWRTKKDFTSAMELLIYDDLEDVDVQNAKKYIITNNYDNGMLLINNESNVKELEVNIKIMKIRELLKEYPRNAIAWVELSLCYTAIGKEEKATKAMKTAIQLDCNNRYIIRSSVRLFLHYKKYDYAYHILKNSPMLKFDPWVNASYIAVSQLLGKSIGNINASRYLIESEKFSNFNISELACSLGYLELSSGRDKEAKKMLKKSLLDPNDNTAAQLQWISKNRIKIQDIDNIDSGRIKNNYEFDTIKKCYCEDFDGAIKSAEEWIKDDVISTTPDMVASSIYASIFDDYSKSEEKILEALKREKDNIKLNTQLAFCKIGLEQYDVAEKLLNKLEIENNDKENKIFILADKGMLNFRLGNEEDGEKFYLEAVRLANQNNMLHLKGSALFHLAKEKYRIKSITLEKNIKEAQESYKYIKDPIVLYNIKKFETEIKKKK